MERAEFVLAGKRDTVDTFLVKQQRKVGLFGPLLVTLGTFFTDEFVNSACLLGNAFLASVHFRVFSQLISAGNAAVRSDSFPKVIFRLMLQLFHFLIWRTVVSGGRRERVVRTRGIMALTSLGTEEELRD